MDRLVGAAANTEYQEQKAASGHENGLFDGSSGE